MQDANENRGREQVVYGIIEAIDSSWLKRKKNYVECECITVKMHC